MFDKLKEVVARYENVEARLASPDVAANQNEFQKLSKEHAHLQPLVAAYKEYVKKVSDFENNKDMIAGDDAELKEMAMEENKVLEEEIEKLAHELRILLLPKDPNDDKNILMELRAGAGGDEAGIFASDLYRLYGKYAENLNWKVELMSLSHNSAGGYKEVICMIRGENVYSRLKFESGVHRVQRVPKTETQGRVHTSTVTLAVLPEADDVEIKIDPAELRIDVFRSSGPGGQSVNTTDSAVRITHIPTGVVVICQDEKSQHKNKAKAMKVLQTRLLDAELRKQQASISQDRRSQLGTGDRSEKIRTYNYPQGRVTDHRIGKTVHNLDAYMEGEIGEMLDTVISHYQAEALKAQAGEKS